MRARADETAAWVVAAVTAALLLAGAFTFTTTLGTTLFAVAGGVGLAYSTVLVAIAIAKRSFGVDAIAVAALAGALAVHEELAAAVIALMVASGRSLEAWAGARARRDLQLLVARQPTRARRYEGRGLIDVAVDDVDVGDLILVGPGEVVPVDGVVANATAVVDESALTGEPLPSRCEAGDPVRSGVVNAAGPFDLRATTVAAESAYAGLVRLVREAESAPAPFVRLADRVARWFLPATALAAVVAGALGGAPRAVAVLVVATPCPLVIAAPVAFVAALTRAARRGVVVKGGAVLERLARCTTLMLDKTGTLTAGRPVLSSIETAPGYDASATLALAASLDQVSPHVVASAVVRAATARGLELRMPHETKELPGEGIEGFVDDRRVTVGSQPFVRAGTPDWARPVRRRARIDGALTIDVAVDGVLVGLLMLEDPVRPDAASTIRGLRRSGILRVVMVTGDRSDVAEAIGALVDVDEVLADRTPSEKLDDVRRERAKAATMMVGDGINDAPALAIADVGVALAARGATASSEAADVVLTVDELGRLGDARLLAHAARRVALESVTVGMLLSLAAMVVAGFGLLPAVYGAISQEALDVAVIANALRVLRYRPRGRRLPGADADLAGRFVIEHRAVSAVGDKLRAAADALPALAPGAAVATARALAAELARVVLPHERAEEGELYPAIDRAVGNRVVTAPMSRGHAEIAHRARRLERLLEEIGEDATPADVAELRDVLYGLHAVLMLHTAEEEEGYRLFEG